MAIAVHMYARCWLHSLTGVYIYINGDRLCNIAMHSNIPNDNLNVMLHNEF